MNPVICVLDFETNGLDTDNNELTEVAYVIKRLFDKKPMKIGHAYFNIEGEVPQIITDMTGIDKRLLDNFGVDKELIIKNILEDFSKFEVEYVMAHNGNNFDKKFMDRYVRSTNESLDSSGIVESKKYFDIPWIDSRHDIDWPFSSRRLVHLAVEFGFLNPFPHDALSDVLTTIRVVEEAIKEEIVTMETLIRNGTTSKIRIRCDATFDTKELAKDLRYRFNSNAKKWEKEIREDQYEEEEKLANEKGLRVRKLGVDECTQM